MADWDQRALLQIAVWKDSIYNICKIAADFTYFN